MKYVLVNFRDVKTPDELHELFKRKLGFPEYYGGNLDALHDALTESPEEVSFFFWNCEGLPAELERTCEGLRRMGEDLEETGRFHFRFYE